MYMHTQNEKQKDMVTSIVKILLAIDLNAMESNISELFFFSRISQNLKLSIVCTVYESH